MNRWATFILVLILTAPAMAADSATVPMAADKSHYTLFNPVPVDQLRDQDPDRPNKTNTPHTVDAGHLQIESGVFDFTFSRASINDTTIALAQENFRLGILNNLELNAAISLFNSAPVPNLEGDDRDDSIGDLYLGGKWNIWGNDADENPWTTSLAIQPQFKMPTANREVGNGHFEVTINVPFLVNLPADFRLGLQTSLSDQRNLENTSSVLGWQNSISVDRTFFDRFDIYLEYWASITTEHHTKSPQTIDIGMIVAINSALAIDTGFNFGLNNASPDYEWVAGITARF